MIKLSWGQGAVLAAASLPMAGVGVAGAVATYVNMDNVLHRGASALGLVAAGEGATLICALVALAVTLMGQHTPATVRAGMWLVPIAASGVGVALAPTTSEAVVMAFTPLAMTAAGEGVAFVARRVVAYRTGVDIEQQRRSGLLLWHANRAANGGRIGSKLSGLAVWRLTRKFAETDTQLSVQLGEIQRFRIQQGADANLSAVLSGAQNRPELPSAAAAGLDRYTATLDGRAAALDPVQGHVPYERTEIPADQWNFQVLDPVWRERAENLGQVSESKPVQRIELDADPDAAPTLLTVADVALMKGVERGTVRSWAHRGKIMKVIVDGKVYFRADDPGLV